MDVFLDELGIEVHHFIGRAGKQNSSLPALAL
jgi:hypothetical protein